MSCQEAALPIIAGSLGRPGQSLMAQARIGESLGVGKQGSLKGLRGEKWGLNHSAEMSYFFIFGFGLQEDFTGQHGDVS